MLFKVGSSGLRVFDLERFASVVQRGVGVDFGRFHLQFNHLLDILDHQLAGAVGRVDNGFAAVS